MNHLTDSHNVHNLFDTLSIDEGIKKIDEKFGSVKRRANITGLNYVAF